MKLETKPRGHAERELSQAEARLVGARAYEESDDVLRALECAAWAALSAGRGPATPTSSNARETL